MQNKPEQASETITDLSPEADATPYLEALKIPTYPFAVEIEQSSFYLDAAREKLLNQLLHLAQSSGLLLVVSAEDGCGKTTLLSQFMQRAGSALRCCPISAGPSMTEQQLLAKMGACLELPENLNKTAALKLLEDQAFILQRNDLLPVMLIDDAHTLPADTLALLLQLQRSDNTDENSADSPWKIVLFTHPGLTAELMQLNARMHFIHLPAMDEQQTAKYLLHRLRMAGFKQESPFTDRDIAFIHKHAQGNLAQVHQLAHQVLLKKHTRIRKPMEQKQMDKPGLKIKPGVWLSIIAVIILSMILFFQERINKVVDSANTTELALPQDSLEIPTAQEYILKKIPDPEPKLVDITGTAKDKAMADSEDKSIEQPATATTIEQQHTEARPKQLAAKEETTEKSLPTTDTVTTTVAIQPPEQSKPAPVTKNKAAAKLETMLQRHRIHDKSWIMQQSPATFTAQLIGSSTAETLYRLAKNPAMGDKAAIYHVLRNGKDWYVLIYGNYPDKETIRKAVAKLPASLRKGGPWLRNFEAVQAEIRAGKK